jgi:hypothetical protein
MKVLSVQVFENKSNKRIEGFCSYEIPLLPNISDNKLLLTLVEYEIGINYAGLTAEKYHFKTTSGSDKFPIFLRDGSSDDTLAAAALIRQYNVVAPGKKRYNFKKKKINQILHQLQNNWDDVVLIAHALFSKKRLSSEDIETLLIKKSPNKKFWKNQFKIINSIFDKFSSLDEKKLKIILQL